MNVNLQEIINKLQTAKGELQKQQRFARFATGLDELISHTSEPLMLMVMGSFSTGKSSFINALVGEEIAAVEAKPTTAVVTKLCYGQQDKLLLHFRDGKVQSATPQEFTRMTAVNDEEMLNEVHEKLDYVERQMPLEILKQVSIIDSPGLNDVKEKRSEATERFVSKADTVLWMFSSWQRGKRWRRWTD
ncbi:dynamin family protein [Phascolarctobacterium succinatutens]|uniref:dynamin family protein n=1 Tax=Phascolarctobacterium succinatutens TaxID=626940 RepID=UPI0026E996F5|nr:dynamin family protein [Phascolarctobacterium succinatutens]